MVGAAALGRTLAELGVARDCVLVTALLREGKRTLAPQRDSPLQADHVSCCSARLPIWSG
jgi:hypothetical protein